MQKQIYFISTLSQNYNLNLASRNEIISNMKNALNAYAIFMVGILSANDFRILRTIILALTTYFRLPFNVGFKFVGQILMISC